MASTIVLKCLLTKTTQESRPPAGPAGGCQFTWDKKMRFFCHDNCKIYI